MAFHFTKISTLVVLFFLFFSCNETKNKEQYISYGNSFALNSSNHIPVSINESNHETLTLQTHLTPLNNNELNIYWEIIKKDFPVAWDYSFCDNTKCYYELPANNRLNLINSKSAEEDKALKLAINTFGVKGKGALVLLIKDSEQTKSDTLYFEASY